MEPFLHSFSHFILKPLPLSYCPVSATKYNSKKTMALYSPIVSSAYVGRIEALVINCVSQPVGNLCDGSFFSRRGLVSISRQMIRNTSSLVQSILSFPMPTFLLRPRKTRLRSLTSPTTPILDSSTPRLILLTPNLQWQELHPLQTLPQ